jgi:hypothetical protein
MRARALILLFTPVVAGWAAWQRRRVLRRGHPLTPAQRQLAAAMGVDEPERIRLLVVERLPIPGGGFVRALSRRLGLPGPDVDGLTLGEAILIRDEALCDELLAHECRHVHQYEDVGSLRIFLDAYLRQVASHGYRAAPFEVDAREAAAAFRRCRRVATGGDERRPSPPAP